MKGKTLRKHSMHEKREASMHCIGVCMYSSQLKIDAFKVDWKTSNSNLYKLLSAAFLRYYPSF